MRGGSSGRRIERIEWGKAALTRSSVGLFVFGEMERGQMVLGCEREEQ